MSAGYWKATPGEAGNQARRYACFPERPKLLRPPSRKATGRGDRRSGAEGRVGSHTALCHGKGEIGKRFPHVEGEAQAGRDDLGVLAEGLFWAADRLGRRRRQ